MAHSCNAFSRIVERRARIRWDSHDRPAVNRALYAGISAHELIEAFVQQPVRSAYEIVRATWQETRRRRISKGGGERL